LRKNMIGMKTIAVIAVAVIAIIIVTMLMLIEGGEYVARVGRDRISVEEYKVYLHEQVNTFEEIGGADIWEVYFDGENPENVAKRNALNSAIQVKVTKEKAKGKLNISLTEEEENQAVIWARDIYNQIIENENIDITMAEFENIMKEIELYYKVFEELTKNFELSEMDFEMFYREEMGEMEVSREEAKEIYIAQKKIEIFQNQYEQWEREARIKRNNEVLESIRVRQ